MIVTNMGEGKWGKIGTALLQDQGEQLIVDHNEVSWIIQYNIRPRPWTLTMSYRFKPPIEL